MGNLFSFDVKSDTKTGSGLGSISARAQNLKPFWTKEFAPRYFAAVQDLFDLEGQSRSMATGQFGPGHWAPLSPVYRAWKERHFPGKKILERTGKLKESLEWNGRRLGRYGFFQATTDSVVFGTDVPYAKYHKSGTPRMPAREFLPVPDAKYWAPLMKQWLLGGEYQGREPHYTS